jgi:hypothetical protein
VKPCSLALREEHILKVFENIVVTQPVHTTGRKQHEDRGNYVMRRCMIYTITQISIGFKSRKMRLTGHIPRVRDENFI